MDSLTVTPRRPSVAVLLSTYNGAAYLEAQLESLRAQEDVLVRVHVRDDGSTDSTCSILRDYGEIWTELRNSAPGPNIGAAASFLQLLQTAPGDADFYAF